jgi:hypothetical protein
MSASIFLIDGDGKLVAMNEQPYDSEALLQELLAIYPDVLAGDDTATTARRWLLISREMGVPSEQDGSSRWAVDHLFVDQDGVPTLVEVKRSTDTRIRREVVGQMLDYAANAVVYWPVERLRGQFEASVIGNGHDAVSVFEETFGPGFDEEAFWRSVATNLQAGRVRLVFVADVIPPELRRIVEFLSEQMNPAEVLAIEVRQYVGEGVRTLVPTLLGQTAKSQSNKPSVAPSSRQWDEPSFFEALGERDPGAVDIARRLLEWARIRDLRVWYGKGKSDGSYFPVFDYEGRAYSTFSVWTYGRVEILFQSLKAQPPFDEESLRQELRRRLNTISGIRIPDDAIGKRPTFPITTLRSDDACTSFVEVLDWVLDEICKF